MPDPPARAVGDDDDPRGATMRRAVLGDEPNLRKLRLEALAEAPEAFGSTYGRRGPPSPMSRGRQVREKAVRQHGPRGDQARIRATPRIRARHTWPQPDLDPLDHLIQVRAQRGISIAALGSDRRPLMGTLRPPRTLQADTSSRRNATAVGSASPIPLTASRPAPTPRDTSSFGSRWRVPRKKRSSAMRWSSAH
jgi:hypothetical protein